MQLCRAAAQPFRTTRLRRTIQRSRRLSSTVDCAVGAPAPASVPARWS